MDSSKVNLSIIIISYNTLAMTRDCIESVYANIKGLNVQVVVVDNDSVDGSVLMLQEEFPFIDLIVNTENTGFAAANNQGFDIVKSELVLLLNSDTIILKDVLGNSVDYMLANPDVGALGCRVLNTDLTMQPTCSGYPTLARLFFLTAGLDRLRNISLFDSYLLRSWKRDSERDVDVISGCYLLTRKKVLEDVGGLDDSFFFFGEETDWCLRMRKSGWVLKFSPIGEIIHHGGGSVKKLNHLRDVMLTSATVRLHRKNSGIGAAIIAFAILFVFNLSRASFWVLRSLFNEEAKSRARHFQKVVSCTAETWPKG